MKVCPQCKTEYDDSYEFCEKDNTELEAISEEDAVEENVEETAAEAEASDFKVNETNVAAEDKAPEVKTSVAAAGASNNSSALPKILALIGVFLLIGAGLVFWKSKVGAHHATDLTSPVTKKDMELILADMNPMMLRQLSQSPEAKKELAENVKELFALASQAEKEGTANDENVKRELENIEYEILAVTYDKAINKDKGPMPPFGFIGEDQVTAFWNGEGGSRTIMDSIGLGSNNIKSREAAFQRFLDSKIALAKEGGNIQADREPSEDEIRQAKDYFAKTRIYYVEALSKKGDANSGLPEDFFLKADLQTRLQKAQFLARRYAGKELAEKMKVTDEDVQNYLNANPDLGNIKEAKKAKADELLAKAKSGGDFAALAKEFSEDPGSKEKGGAYENITEGSFVPEFEKAVFGGMKPGEVYPELVPTKFGYHIIKLEKLGETKANDGTVKRTFDARHILISTMYKDPNDPMAREMPVEDFVKQKLQGEKEKTVLDEIKANNPVEVAEDFDVPTPAVPEQPELPPGMMPGQVPPGAEMEEPAPKPDAKTAPKANAPKPPAKPAEPKKP